VIATDPNAGSAVTFDQNGNVTGQGSLPTYSWPGYAYQNNGLVAQVRQPMVDFGLGFAPFQAGSLSHGNTYTRLIQAKVFVPFEIAAVGQPPQTAGFVATLNQRYKKAAKGQTIIDVEAFAFGKATLSQFEDALTSYSPGKPKSPYAPANKFVAYVGHGVAFANDPVVLQDPNTFHASALEFSDTNLEKHYYTVSQPAICPFRPMLRSFSWAHAASTEPS
jgi:hypothetical protein